MADSKQRAHNKRYFVLPDWNHNLQVFCKEELTRLQTPVRRRYFEHGHWVDKKDGTKRWVKGGLKVEKIYQMSPKADHLTVMKECFYFTPTKLNNEGAISQEEKSKKRVEWLRYMEQVRYKRAQAKRSAIDKKALRSSGRILSGLLATSFLLSCSGDPMVVWTSSDAGGVITFGLIVIGFLLYFIIKEVRKAIAEPVGWFCRVFNNNQC